jgi:hypothetical protein
VELLSSESETQVLLESLQHRFYQNGTTRIFPKTVGANDPHQVFATPAHGVTWIDVLSHAKQQEQSFLLNKVDITKGRAQDTSA